VLNAQQNYSQVCNSGSSVERPHWLSYHVRHIEFTEDLVVRLKYQ